jgi:hypothetical protein
MVDLELVILSGLFHFLLFDLLQVVDDLQIGDLADICAQKGNEIVYPHFNVQLHRQELLAKV